MIWQSTFSESSLDDYIHWVDVLVKKKKKKCWQNLEQISQESGLLRGIQQLLPFILQNLSNFPKASSEI